MKQIDKNENQIVFRTEKGEIDETLANSIRRYVNHIPVVAIDEVEISKNDSALYDETVAHRIGLIPLKPGKKKGGTLKLETKKEGAVLSGDFTGDFEVVYDKMPITILSKGQEMNLSATTKEGTGSEHAKFSPGMLVYRNVTEITLDKEFKDEIARILPEIKITDKGNKIMIRDEGREDVADVCEGLANKERKEAEVEVKDEMVFIVESFGQMPSEEIFKNSINVLKKDLTEIGKLAK